MATAVAAGLVAAYADLRQLQFLLQSLLEALLAQTPPKAAAVLCVPAFVQALRKVSQTNYWVNCALVACAPWGLSHFIIVVATLANKATTQGAIGS